MHSALCEHALDRGELKGLLGLQGLSLFDAEFAGVVASYRWVVDGVDARAGNAIGSLGNMAREIVENAGDDTYSNAWSLLVEQPWFTDGLVDEELTFVSLLGMAFTTHVDCYSDLLERHDVRTSSISPPLSGTVNVSIIRPTRFPVLDDIFNNIEKVISFYEMFIGVAFPCNSLEVLLVPRWAQQGAIFSDCSIVSGMNDSHDRVDWGTLYHEMAHAYDMNTMNPHAIYTYTTWSTEGAADFLSYLALDKVGERDLEESIAHLQETSVPNCRKEHGVQTVMEAEMQQECAYQMGSYFLLRVSESIGQDSVAAVLRELHLRSISGIPADEEEVYEIFLANTPSGLEDDFRDVYRRIHGGPYADAVVER